jgi:hypothetical protein
VIGPVSVRNWFSTTSTSHLPAGCDLVINFNSVQQPIILPLSSYKGKLNSIDPENTVLLVSIISEVQ